MIQGILASMQGMAITPLFNQHFMTVLIMFIPFVLFFEIPWTLFVLVGLVRYRLERGREPVRRDYFPSVSCIITCYSEGEAIRQTIRSLTEQIYPGKIQLLAMIDGAAVNTETLRVAESLTAWVASFPNRELFVAPKWQRGGVVSSSNAALNFVKGDIVMKVDGDSSFDNTMVERATRHFVEPEVVAVSGCIRARNAGRSIWASFQAIEYFISIQSARSALSAFNMVNNISGAFGVFRKELLTLVSGWDAGTAEDLDMTMRIKSRFADKKRRFRIVFDPEAMCFTDVPDTLKGFLKQRLRWEGDFFYIIAKHKYTISPGFLGWPNFISVLVQMFTSLVVPALVFVYTFWLLFTFPVTFFLGLSLITYVFYVVMLSFLYFLSIAMVSERPWEDFSRAHLLPLMPGFMFIGRINAFIANIWEVVGRGHEDTSMAPWWTLRKNKF